MKQELEKRHRRGVLDKCAKKPVYCQVNHILLTSCFSVFHAFPLRRAHRKWPKLHREWAKQQGIKVAWLKKIFFEHACLIDWLLPTTALQVSEAAGAFKRLYPDAVGQITSHRELEAC